MKEGYVLEKSRSGVSAEDLEKINRLSRRKMKAGEVYVFSVVLCDNEIDRDGERFSIPALTKLAELFIGKTGIFDHSMKSGDQTARIFETALERDDSRLTKAGESYHRLTARAYMPRTTRNEDLILEIDAGIKKEVSVGCRIGRSACSVCGADRKAAACEHVKGRVYTKQGSVPCHTVLEDPLDAYEWSFVAVPAQPEAGVIKSYAAEKKHTSAENIVKRLRETRDEICLSAGEASALLRHIFELQSRAEEGREYREQLTREFVRQFGALRPDMELTAAKNVAERMTVKELSAFVRAAGEQKEAPGPQLAPAKTKARQEKNRGFMI